MDERRLRSIGKANNLSVRAVLRLAWIAEAEAHARRTTGRPLTYRELRRVVADYPGD